MTILGVVFLIILLQSNVASRVTQDTGVSTVLVMLVLGISTFVGLKDNEWSRNNLITRGFTHIKAIKAGSAREVICGIEQDHLIEMYKIQTGKTYHSIRNVRKMD